MSGRYWGGRYLVTYVYMLILSGALGSALTPEMLVTDAALKNLPVLWETVAVNATVSPVETARCDFSRELFLGDFPWNVNTTWPCGGACPWGNASAAMTESSCRTAALELLVVTNRTDLVPLYTLYRLSDTVQGTGGGRMIPRVRLGCSVLLCTAPLYWPNTSAPIPLAMSGTGNYRFGLPRNTTAFVVAGGGGASLLGLCSRNVSCSGAGDPIPTAMSSTGASCRCFCDRGYATGVDGRPCGSIPGSRAPLNSEATVLKLMMKIGLSNVSNNETASTVALVVASANAALQSLIAGHGNLSLMQPNTTIAAGSKLPVESWVESYRRRLSSSIVVSSTVPYSRGNSSTLLAVNQSLYGVVVAAYVRSPVGNLSIAIGNVDAFLLAFEIFMRSRLVRRALSMSSPTAAWSTILPIQPLMGSNSCRQLACQLSTSQAGPSQSWAWSVWSSYGTSSVVDLTVPSVTWGSSISAPVSFYRWSATTSPQRSSVEFPLPIAGAVSLAGATIVMQVLENFPDPRLADSSLTVWEAGSSIGVTLPLQRCSRRTTGVSAGNSTCRYRANRTAPSFVEIACDVDVGAISNTVMLWVNITQSSVVELGFDSDALTSSQLALNTSGCPSLWKSSTWAAVHLHWSTLSPMELTEKLLPFSGREIPASVIDNRTSNYTLLLLAQTLGALPTLFFAGALLVYLLESKRCQAGIAFAAFIYAIPVGCGIAIVILQFQAYTVPSSDLSKEANNTLVKGLGATMIQYALFSAYCLVKGFRGLLKGIRKYLDDEGDMGKSEKEATVLLLLVAAASLTIMVLSLQAIQDSQGSSSDGTLFLLAAMFATIVGFGCLIILAGEVDFGEPKLNLDVTPLKFVCLTVFLLSWVVIGAASRSHILYGQTIQRDHGVLVVVFSDLNASTPIAAAYSPNTKECQLLSFQGDGGEWSSKMGPLYAKSYCDADGRMSFVGAITLSACEGRGFHRNPTGNITREPLSQLFSVGGEDVASLRCVNEGDGTSLVRWLTKRNSQSDWNPETVLVQADPGTYRFQGLVQNRSVMRFSVGGVLMESPVVAGLLPAPRSKPTDKIPQRGVSPLLATVEIQGTSLLLLNGTTVMPRREGPLIWVEANATFLGTPLPTPAPSTNRSVVVAVGAIADDAGLNYRGIKFSALDLSALMGDGAGFSVSFWLRALPDTVGWVFVLADDVTATRPDGGANAVERSLLIDWLDRYLVNESTAKPLGWSISAALHVDAQRRTLTLLSVSSAGKIIAMKWTERLESVFDGEWHFVALTLIAVGGSDALRLYVDGRSSLTDNKYIQCFDRGTSLASLSTLQPLQAVSPPVVGDSPLSRVEVGPSARLTVGQMQGDGEVYQLQFHSRTLTVQEVNTLAIPDTRLRPRIYTKESRIAGGIFIAIAGVVAIIAATQLGVELREKQALAQAQASQPDDKILVTRAESADPAGAAPLPSRRGTLVAADSASEQRRDSQVRSFRRLRSHRSSLHSERSLHKVDELTVRSVGPEEEEEKPSGAGAENAVEKPIVAEAPEKGQMIEDTKKGLKLAAEGKDAAIAASRGAEAITATSTIVTQLPIIVPVALQVAQNMSLYFDGWSWPWQFQLPFGWLYLPFTIDLTVMLNSVPSFVTYILQFVLAIAVMMFILYVATSDRGRYQTQVVDRISRDGLTLDGEPDEPIEVNKENAIVLGATLFIKGKSVPLAYSPAAAAVNRQVMRRLRSPNELEPWELRPPGQTDVVMVNKASLVTALAEDDDISDWVTGTNYSTLLISDSETSTESSFRTMMDANGIPQGLYPGAMRLMMHMHGIKRAFESLSLQPEIDPVFIDDSAEDAEVVAMEQMWPPIDEAVLKKITDAANEEKKSEDEKKGKEKDTDENNNLDKENLGGKLEQNAESNKPWLLPREKQISICIEYSKVHPTDSRNWLLLGIFHSSKEESHQTLMKAVEVSEMDCFKKAIELSSDLDHTPELQKSILSHSWIRLGRELNDEEDEAEERKNEEENSSEAPTEEAVETVDGDEDLNEHEEGDKPEDVEKAARSKPEADSPKVERESRRCFLQAVKADPSRSLPWIFLGTSIAEPESITLEDGRTFTKKECFVQAINGDLPRWGFYELGKVLANGEFIEVSGERLTAEACLLRSGNPDASDKKVSARARLRARLLKDWVTTKEEPAVNDEEAHGGVQDEMEGHPQPQSQDLLSGDDQAPPPPRGGGAIVVGPLHRFRKLNVPLTEDQTAMVEEVGEYCFVVGMTCELYERAYAALMFSSDLVAQAPRTADTHNELSCFEPKILKEMPLLLSPNHGLRPIQWVLWAAHQAADVGSAQTSTGVGTLEMAPPSESDRVKLDEAAAEVLRRTEDALMNSSLEEADWLYLWYSLSLPEEEYWHIFDGGFTREYNDKLSALAQAMDNRPGGTLADYLRREAMLRPLPDQHHGGTIAPDLSARSEYDSRVISLLLTANPTRSGLHLPLLLSVWTLLPPQARLTMQALMLLKYAPSVDFPAAVSKARSGFQLQSIERCLAPTKEILLRGQFLEVREASSSWGMCSGDSSQTAENSNEASGFASQPGPNPTPINSGPVQPGVVKQTPDGKDATVELRFNPTYRTRANRKATDADWSAVHLHAPERHHCPMHNTWLIPAVDNVHIAAKKKDLTGATYPCASRAGLKDTADVTSIFGPCPCDSPPPFAIPEQVTEWTEAREELFVCSVDGCNYAQCGVCNQLGGLKKVKRQLAGLRYKAERKGATYIFGLIMVLVAQALYLPAMKSSLVIIFCHRSIRCQFPDCYSPATPAFLFTMACGCCLLAILGVALVMFFASAVYDRKKTILQKGLMKEYIETLPFDFCRNDTKFESAINVITAKCTDERAWAAVLRYDTSVFKGLYEGYEFKFMLLQPVVFMGKLITIAIVLFVGEPDSLMQIMAVAVLEIVQGAWTLLTAAYIEPWIDLLAKATSVHQITQLGMMCLYRADTFEDPRKIGTAYGMISVAVLYLVVLGIVIKNVIPFTALVSILRAKLNKDEPTNQDPSSGTETTTVVEVMKNEGD